MNKDFHTKEGEVFELLMTMVQSSRQGSKKTYREARRDIMRLYHGEDKEYKQIIKTCVSSFRSVNDLNVGDV